MVLSLFSLLLMAAWIESGDISLWLTKVESPGDPSPRLTMPSAKLFPTVLRDRRAFIKDWLTPTPWPDWLVPEELELLAALMLIAF